MHERWTRGQFFATFYDIFINLKHPMRFESQTHPQDDHRYRITDYSTWYGQARALSTRVRLANGRWEDWNGSDWHISFQLDTFRSFNTSKARRLSGALILYKLKTRGVRKCCYIFSILTINLPNMAHLLNNIKPHSSILAQHLSNIKSLSGQHIFAKVHDI